MLGAVEDGATRIVPQRNGIHEGRVRFRVQNIRVAADDGGRFYLCDENGAEAQLPVTGGETELAVDEVFKPNWGQTYTHRLLEWQATKHGMALIYASGAVLPEGSVVVSGFRGVGKSATVLALLEHAVGYLGQDRVVLAGDGSVAALPVPVQLFLSRRYELDAAAARRALSAAELRKVRLLPVLLARARGRVHGRLERELQARFVPFDVARAFPSLRFPERVHLDALVFLIPDERATTEAVPIDASELEHRTAQTMKYLHDAYISPFECMFASAFPDRGVWPVAPLDVSLELLGSLLRGVRGWVLRAKPATPPKELAAAIRSTLTASAG